MIKIDPEAAGFGCVILAVGLAIALMALGVGGCMYLSDHGMAERHQAEHPMKETP